MGLPSFLWMQSAHNTPLFLLSVPPLFLTLLHWTPLAFAIRSTLKGGQSDKRMTCNLSAGGRLTDTSPFAFLFENHYCITSHFKTEEISLVVSYSNNELKV